MPISRCPNCNDYETAKMSNFKRHVERCTRHTRANASTAAPATRFAGPAPGAAQEPRAEPLQRVPESSSPEPRPPSPVPLTRFDAMFADYSTSDGSDAAWHPEPPTPDFRQRQRGERLEPTLVSTPVYRPGRGPAPAQVTKARRPEPLRASDRDFLLTRIAELESTVMKLQHAVCVMDSRMQQFRMATSSWQSITTND